MATPQRCERIVILGAGFGGLTTAVQLAKRLGKREGCEIVVVDKCTHHLYRPWLYEVATGNAPEERLKSGVATPYEDLRTHLSGLGVKVEYQEVIGVDWETKSVKLCDDRGLPFDHLVVALGASPDFYGIEGLEQHAVPMYSLQNALVVQRKLVHLVEQKRRNEIPFIRILIGGAGPTGVEFACEAAQFMKTQVRKKMLGASEYSIELVEASPRPLQALHPQLSAWAKTRLEKLGVKLLLDACIKGAHKDHVVLAPRPLKPGETMDMLVCDFKNENQKEVTTDLLVWCGGFRANPIMKNLGVTLNERGKIEVDDTMQVRNMPGAWAVGDCIALFDPSAKRPVPQLAQGAIHQAELAAENIVRAMRKDPLARYGFPAMHALVPMGGAWGVGEVFGIRFKGVWVWPVRLAADIRYFLRTLPLRSAWKLIRAPLTVFRRNNL
ncbi:MAG: FAD-dependent oxidoreductase [Patescibacteria group bacterium]|nr:MAG: FAD-dependent oxidoreductase [Patescibacteria group bacterium]